MSSVASWLDSVEEPPAVKFTAAQDDWQRKMPRDALSSSPSYRHNDHQPPRPSPSRQRKRPRIMSSRDTISIASSSSSVRTTRTTSAASQSIFNTLGEDRPILVPTPPSTRNRSPSPSRNVLSRLKQATPSVHVCQPGGYPQGMQPEAVQVLRKRLLKDAARGVIPRGLEDQLREADPDQFDELQDWFSAASTAELSAEVRNHRWTAVDKIFKDAKRCHNHHLDESAWMAVVSQVLRAANLEDDAHLVRVHSVQTQQIESKYLPRHAGQSIAKKADLALVFSDDHPAVAEVIAPVRKARPGLGLSQMTDAYTRTVPLVCGIEVKEQGGDYNQAIIQLAIWAAAGLERLRTLQELNTRGGRGTDEEMAPRQQLLPFVGWTVVGHDWKFHIMWKDQDSDVTVLGPWCLLNTGTSSHARIFQLLALIRKVVDWLENVYWPWLRDCILHPLSY